MINNLQQELALASEKALVEYLALQKDERVLIISDSNKREIGLSLFEKSKELAKEALYVEIPPAKINGEEPPKEVAELMQKYDVVICPTTKSLTHTDARRNASKLGIRVATMPGITIETMARCLSADAQFIIDLSDKVKKILENDTVVRVTTELGTDILLPYSGRQILASTGVLREKGNSGNLPSGEVYFAPEEGKSNGTIVFNGSIAGIGLLESPVKVIIENGYATQFIGGSDADKFKEMLGTVGGDAFAIAEFGIGTNPKAKLIGLILEDEKAMGTIHIAFGNNKSMGGIIEVPIHIDGMVLEPDVYVGNTQIMKSGKFLI